MKSYWVWITKARSGFLNRNPRKGINKRKSCLKKYTEWHRISFSKIRSPSSSSTSVMPSQRGNKRKDEEAQALLATCPDPVPHKHVRKVMLSLTICHYQLYPTQLVVGGIIFFTWPSVIPVFVRVTFIKRLHRVSRNFEGIRTQCVDVDITRKFQFYNFSANFGCFELRVLLLLKTIV